VVVDLVSLDATVFGPYWAPAIGGGGTGTWSAANTNWASAAGTQGNGIQSPTGTLLFGATAGTVTVSGGVNAAAGLTFSTDGYTVTNSAITLTGTNAASNTITTATSVGATIASQLAGSNGLTKAGAGTLTFGGSAANILTGTTTVSAGTLQLNKSASTTAIAGNLEVANGATLLISQSHQVNNSAAVTLSGGTITRGAGVSEVFGSLNITGSGILDFGTGAVGNLTFGTYQDNQQTESALLTLNNFMPGNSFTFSSTSFSTNSVGSYFTFGTGYINSSIIDNGGSSFTITAIPEPSTVLAALGLIGLMLWPARRRLLRVAMGSREG
jgi:autotransporter-associated beta strand protein